jgi:gliding motility-associated-like protein
MPVSKDASVCLGSSTQLSATGAFSYQWLNNPSSLNNGQISNPLATPVTTTTYTVAGTDRYRCFSDTASIKITVFPHPTVDAGSDIELLSGSSYPLKPNASNDVENWQWQPGDFLSCTTCASPVATPLSPIDYVVKVTNAAGCTATDTLKVSILCSGNKIYIPSGFTPNNDGLNDRFAIKAFGIRNVHYLRIYDRWGVLVFEKTNFGIDDRSGSWDGTYKGSLLPGGSYVYMTELECNGEKFLQKGTVTLIR